MALTYSPYHSTTNPDGGIVDGAGSAQMNTFFYLKKALIEARKEQYFMPLASVTNMPKHYGKTIKVYEYVPLLDERNVSSQGIDANGNPMVRTWNVYFPPSLMVKTFGAGLGAAAVTAVNTIATAINASATAVAAAAGDVVTLQSTRINGMSDAQKTSLIAHYPEAVYEAFGANLYGNSKDIGTITSKLPVLSENGGRVNRVGFTRIAREGTIAKFGFFYEWTKESMDFDSDDGLRDQLSRELMNGAVQLTEAALQKDLLSNAGVIVYTGAAVSNATISGEGAAAAVSLVDYADLMRLDQILTDNRTPRQTKVITGSRLQDTSTIPSARIAFVGSELVPTLKKMKDLFNNKAFIEVQHYADAGTVLNGEIGAIDAFRFVQVPEMLSWQGQGAAVGTNPGYRATADRYDVFPILVIGDDSFTTIGFQTDGKTVKFETITKEPGAATADRNDPYGEKGFSSIKWYYGILIKRPERIGLIKTVAEI